MKKPTIYIASSWRNCGAVEILTNLLEHNGFEVQSFIRNSTKQKTQGFAEWIKTKDAHEKFTYDTFWAMNADIVIYYGPSGCDAWAEIGAAYAKNRPIYGYWDNGERIGLMRKMVKEWFCDDLKLIHHLVGEYL